jgi:hypothetical protein
MGWKNDFDLEDDIIDMLEKFKNQTRPSSFHGRANMLYALDLVLSFLDHRPESNEEKFEFFKRIAEAGILSDPLILLRVLNNHGNRGISHLADDLISRTELCTAIPGFALISPAFANESELAQNFKSGPMPSFDLGGKYATYAVDGQIGPRVWMFPDEIEAGTVMSLASIIAFGVYPGGVVGSNINYHEIFLGIDRADIDLLTIYPESQALILVPMDLLGQSEYPYKRTKNTHSWYDGDKKIGTEITLSPKETGELPHIPANNLLAIVPSKLVDRVQEELWKLCNRVNSNCKEFQRWVSRMIHYAPQHWGNIHAFNEFLQSTSEGKKLLEEKIG